MHIFASGISPEQIKFSTLDDPIYESFRKEFPDFDVTKITEASMTVKTTSFYKEITDFEGNRSRAEMAKLDQSIQRHP
jgi:hypothetical protein